MPAASNWAVAQAAPFDDAAAVTPNNSADLPKVSTNGLWIGGAGSGNLKVTMSDGSVVTFSGVPAGFFPLRVLRVWATGTDVTAIVALY